MLEIKSITFKERFDIQRSGSDQKYKNIKIKFF